MHPQLDAIDLQILNELQADGRLSIVDLATRIGLSASPTLRRLRALEARGLIKGYRADLDAEKLGLGLLVFVQCTARGYDQSVIAQIREGLEAIPEVIAWHVVSGDYDYLIQVLVPDLKHYERFLIEKLLALPMQSVRSNFAIAERKARAPLPLDHLRGPDGS